MSQESIAADTPSVEMQVNAWHSKIKADSQWHCEWLAMHSRFPEPPTITFMVKRLDKPMEPRHMTIDMRPEDMQDWDDLAQAPVPVSLERLVNLAAGRAVADLRSREDEVVHAPATLPATD